MTRSCSGGRTRSSLRPIARALRPIPPPRGAGRLLSGLLLALFVVWAAGAQAQGSPHPAMGAGGPSSLPTGDGSIRGAIVDEANPGATADLPVALYALQPDGTPGLGSTKTGADGSFEFADVASDPGIVYLVGVRYEEVPYGERTAFVPGQREIDVRIPVEKPTTDTSGVRVLEKTLRIEALGTRLSVQETQRVENSHSAPIYVPPAARSGKSAPFRARLPEGAVDVQAGIFNADESFDQQGDALAYWGPLYPGEQEIHYGYQLPVAAGASDVTLRERLPLGAGRVRVLTAEHGPRVEAKGFSPGEAEEVDGQSLASLVGGAHAPGDSLTLHIRVPETVRDPNAVSLGGAELSIELDDTVLEVTQTQRIVVAPGAHVAGAPGDPLLRFELPLQAELVGVSSDASQLGIDPVDHGIEVVGPLGPGDHDFAFRYRIPALNGDASLDLRFPRMLPTLLLRAADTGLVIESDRLHRLRPQAMGTRTWMLREAFHVEPDEVVKVRFTALDRGGSSHVAAIGFVLAAAAFVLLFVVSPLRRTRAAGPAEEPERTGLAHERDLVYATLRDLEHDFETGKVAAEDYERSRAELRARAVDLMREEHGAPVAGPPVAAVTAVAAGETPDSPPAVVPTSRFCPACGGRVDASWRFCSHCGAELHPAEAAGSEPVG